MSLRTKTILITIAFLILGIFIAGGIYHRKAIGEWFKETFPSKQTVSNLKKENEQKDEKISELTDYINDLKADQTYLLTSTKEYAVNIRGWSPIYLNENQSSLSNIFAFTSNFENTFNFNFWKIYANLCGVDYDTLDLSEKYAGFLGNTSISDPYSFELCSLKNLHITSNEYTGDFEKVVVEDKISDYSYKVFANGETFSSLSNVNLSEYNRVYFVYDEPTNALQVFLFSTDYLSNLDYALVK